jgi:hypothetical protein
MSVTVDAPLPVIEPLSLILGAEVIGWICVGLWAKP